MRSPTHGTAKRPPPNPLLTKPVAPAYHPDALWPLSTVKAITGLSRTSIYDKMNAGTFPQAVKLGGRWTRWRAGNVLKWVKAPR